MIPQSEKGFIRVCFTLSPAGPGTLYSYFSAPNYKVGIATTDNISRSAPDPQSKENYGKMPHLGVIIVPSQQRSLAEGCSS